MELRTQRLESLFLMYDEMTLLLKRRLVLELVDTFTKLYINLLESTWPSKVSMYSIKLKGGNL